MDGMGSHVAPLAAQSGSTPDCVKGNSIPGIGRDESLDTVQFRIGRDESSTTVQLN